MLTRLRWWAAAAATLIFLLSAGSHDALAQAFPNPIPLPTCDNNTIPLYNVCEVIIPQTEYDASEESAAYTGPDIKAVFRNLRTNTQRTVRAFYDKLGSDIVFRVRFNPDEAPAGAGDTWEYSLSCTMQNGGVCPQGIPLGSGRFTVTGSAESGFLRRDAAQTHRFAYDNGYHPFIWGQTYYDIVPNVRAAGGWEEAVQKSTQDYHLNKVRMLLYPFGGFYYADSQPFVSATNHDQLDLGHWRAFDRVVNKLYGLRDPKGNRILAEVILFTDTNPRSLAGPVPDDRYVRYAVARYGAFPNVMWCMTNEWQLTRPPGATTNALKKAYFNDRAATLVQNDPWTLPPDANQQRRRATSIHPNNDTPVFQFYDQTWPSHAVLQYSIGHGLCDGQACANSDEWANFSIAVNFRTANNLGKNWPVANDEYGYINSWKESIGKCLISQHDQRKGMWAIAVAGGYGTFGDNTGSCPDPVTGNKSIQPILRSDWRPDPAYNDIRNLFKYFNTLLPSDWWLMKGNNNRVAQVPGPKAMRVYAMEQPGTPATAGRGNHVVYSVPVNNTGSVASGQFKVKNLPKGNYLTAFYNPRNGAQRNPTKKEIKRVTATQFATPSYDDWVFRIYPDPQPPRPKSSFDEYEIVWVGDSLPAGAVPAGYNENWTWTESDPTPVSGTYAHQSPLVADIHQHYFTGATETLKVNAGDTLYAYVYLDPANPPSEVMLQWFDGNWEHRAYWGANLLPWGMNGTTSRRYMGALPAAGQWVRLEVPASLVGLEGRTLDGMAFTLHGGTATWDDAGKTGAGVAATNLAVNKTTSQSSTAGGAPAVLAADGNTNGNYYASSVTHTNLDAQAWWQVDLGGKSAIDQIKIWPRTDCCADRLSNFYVFVSDEPFTSSDVGATQEQPGVSTYFVAGQATQPTVINTDGESGRYVRVQLTGSNYLSLAEVEVVGKSGLSAPPPAPNMTVSDASVVEGNVGTSGAVFTVSLSAAATNTVTVNYSTANGTAVAGSDYTAASGSLVFSPGQTTKTVSVSVIGDVVVEGNETFFLNLSGASGAVVADGQGQGVIINDDSAPPPSQPGEVVWVEDGVPPGTTLGGEEPWNWTGAGSYPTPFSGASAHHSPYAQGMHQHWFVGATGAHALTPGAGDKLFAYVFLDPMNPPSEIMLQWADSSSWEHRAYWGANLLPWGTNGTASRRYMGPLPPAGQWVRLEVPANTVGLENVTLQGMAFTLYGGMATWDYAGKVSAETVWVEDGLPAGATPGAENDGWNWVGGLDPAPFSGALAHKSNVAAGLHQHYFTGATGTLAVTSGSVLYAYVYLDPFNPPSQVMLQWNDGSWEHRAYWGANLLPWGVDGTAGRRYMGALPPTGRWVRLEVPANLVGLEGRNVNGMAFSLYGGRATWDRAGKRP